ncbi:hypothetical protein C7H09_00125 [Marinobacter fuscus]|uniref:Glycosyltransferase family 1 protein n=1 Tax=Marinobacter fuscus TaxID=2109942 RepID=A0A2T1KW24_9GAMM|nr:glycosyltransferase family 1 protein [Marinobacter fuscus]PSF14297.1 hypothetical protein C7H09_00125 [Marinobacter fuscus]
MDVLIRLDSLVAPRTGIGYYTEHLVRALAELPSMNLVGVFGGRRLAGDALADLLDDRAEPDANGSASLMARLRPLVRAVPGAYRVRQAMRDRAASRAAHGVRIYHEPNFVPFPFSGSTVLTIHDLSHLRYPEYHPPERVNFLERYLPKAIQNASAIIADSHFTADEVCAFFPFAADKVYPVHLGVEDSLGPLQGPELQTVLAGYGLSPGAYLLSVATLEPRKNLAGLVKAYRNLPESVQSDLPLVLVGGAGWKNEELKRLLAERKGAGRVILTGRVPRSHLSGLLSGARLFVYPSFYEGFGLPIAEARACGTPILTTSYGAMKEVAGDQAFLVHPDELSGGLRQALSQLPERLEPYRFCWRDTARNTRAVYQRVLGE